MNQNEMHKLITGQDLDQQIQDMLCCFDFEKVHKVMKFLDWKWASSRTENGVPSVSELMLKARELIYSSIAGISNRSDPNYFVMTGGFKVSVHRCDDGYLVIELQFSISDVDNRE